MKKLTKAEEEIMVMIWKKGACTVSDLIKEMNEPKPAHSTISSFIRILEKKGYVKHKAYGRTYEYFPTREKSDYSKGRLSGLISDFFDGSVDELVSFIVKEDKMSINEMQSLLDKIKNDGE
jgi:BlaI family penicillinase repressor